ncbi:MAG: aldose 1-epimerase family protein [Bacteroidia bacterium]|nr:aldose 1-epimerase family protein [Bacteroidia bacterium]
MPTLSNDHLAIHVNMKGAELSSVKSPKTGIEYIWQANPDIWGRHAPVLFPIVGRLKNDSYQVDGNSYCMKQHGLARNMEFMLVEGSETHMLFRLESSEESLAAYPFEFSFEIEYQLLDNQLVVQYGVLNKGNVDMPFSIGAHPGFAVPMGGNGELEDYEIFFSNKESLDRYLLEGGLFSGETSPAMTAEQVLPLTKGMFDLDALVFHHPESSYVVLRSEKHDHSVRMSLRGFPYLGIWAKPGAPFVCIEPWQGLADYTDSDGDLFKKKGIMILAPNQVHQCGYEIIFN